MVAIVVALESEAKFFLENVENAKNKVIGGKQITEGRVNGKKVVLALCGIGKVNAAMTTQLLIDTYSPNVILNFGTCGGTNSSVVVKNYYAVDKCCQFDFDVSELDPVPVGYIQDYNSVYFYSKKTDFDFLKYSSLASADRFSDSKKDNELINSMDCSLRDMEGGAIGEVCTANKVPFVMIKGVTDVYGSGTSGEQFYQNLTAVCGGFKEIIPKIISSL